MSRVSFADKGSPRLVRRCANGWNAHSNSLSILLSARNSRVSGYWRIFSLDIQSILWIFFSFGSIRTVVETDPSLRPVEWPEQSPAFDWSPIQTWNMLPIQEIKLNHQILGLLSQQTWCFVLGRTRLTVIVGGQSNRWTTKIGGQFESSRESESFGSFHQQTAETVGCPAGHRWAANQNLALFIKCIGVCFALKISDRETDHKIALKDRILRTRSPSSKWDSDCRTLKRLEGPLYLCLNYSVNVFTNSSRSTTVTAGHCQGCGKKVLDSEQNLSGLALASSANRVTSFGVEITWSEIVSEEFAF